MYVFDTNIFRYLDNMYPKRFTSLWQHLDKLVAEKRLWSVKEVFNEIEYVCQSSHVADWAKNNRTIFRKPQSTEEYKIIMEIFKYPQYRDFIRKEHLLKGYPVADPFIIASAKVNNAFVVTQEKLVKNGARIPNACLVLETQCINMEQFLEREKLEF
ncbi:MAG: DUF4411 family protein [Candidatus Omnitrophica bacterium]|nr:DUF4411 family protein [Candidatus Omnitrophota bacterium]